MGYADQPRYSRDGRFFWDGSRWSPVEDRLWDVRLSEPDAAAPGPACGECGATPVRPSAFGRAAVQYLVATLLGLGFTVAGLVTYLATAP